MVPLLSLITTLAPSLVKWAIGDKAGEIAEQVTGAVQDIFGTDDPREIEKAIAQKPELAWKLKEKLLDIQDRQMQRDHEEMLERLKDVDQARQREVQIGDKLVGRLAVTVLLTFTLSSMVTMVGCFLVLKYGLQVKDQNLAIAVAGLVGNITGYLAANAQQVLSYYFGSSRGSNEKTSALSDAMMNFAKATLTKDGR